MMVGRKEEGVASAAAAGLGTAAALNGRLIACMHERYATGVCSSVEGATARQCAGEQFTVYSLSPATAAFNLWMAGNSASPAIPGPRLRKTQTTRYEYCLEHYLVLPKGSMQKTVWIYASSLARQLEINLLRLAVETHRVAHNHGNRPFTRRMGCIKGRAHHSTDMIRLALLSPLFAILLAMASAENKIEGGFRSGIPMRFMNSGAPDLIFRCHHAFRPSRPLHLTPDTYM